MDTLFFLKILALANSVFKQNSAYNNPVTGASHSLYVCSSGFHNSKLDNQFLPE